MLTSNLSAEEKRKGGVKRTGEMMLAGWKLLQTTCPICIFPLMSKGEDMRCPCCDMPVMMAPANYEMPKNAAPLATTTTTTTTSFHEKVKAVDASRYEDAEVGQPSPESKSNSSSKTSFGTGPTSFEEMKKEFDKSKKKMNSVSNMLGEKMLQGWTMLSECCPAATCAGTPLMGAKGNANKMVCVSCDTEYTHSSSKQLVPINGAIPAKNSSMVAAAPAKTVSCASLAITAAPSEEGFAGAGSSLDRFRIDREDPSVKLSQKMLQGWALLDAVCTGSCKGSVPLLRSRDGEVVCVGCGSSSASKGAIDVDQRTAQKNDFDKESVFESKSTSSQLPSPPPSITKAGTQDKGSTDHLSSHKDDEIDEDDEFIDDLNMDEEAYQIQRARLLEQMTQTPSSSIPVQQAKSPKCTSYSVQADAETDMKTTRSGITTAVSSSSASSTTETCHADSGPAGHPANYAIQVLGKVMIVTGVCGA